MTETDQLLAPGAHYELVIATRDALWEGNRDYSDIELMVTRFGFQIIEDDHNGPNWGRTLMDGDQANLIQLARFLKTAPDPMPEDEATSAELNSAGVDAYTELVAAETALRDVVRLAVPDWQSQLEPEDIQKLETKRLEEDKKRDGITVSQDLLDYSEVYLLQKLIGKNWPAVKPILDDKARTEVYLGIIFDIRNTIGHSRPVVPSERLLLAGAAGQIRNQLARYRSSQDGAAMYYSSIDSARDSAGQDANRGISYPSTADRTSVPRFDVGDEIEFELAGTDPRDRELTWSLHVYPDLPMSPNWDATRESATGGRVRLKWTVAHTDVGELRYVAIFLRNSSRYQRNRAGYDDACFFNYHVNPPLD